MSDHLSHRGRSPGGPPEAALRPTWTSPGRVDGPAWPCTGRGLPGRRVTATPVRSYRTISPLPVRDSRVAASSAVYFCGTIPRVSPGGRYPPPRPMVSGLSSRGFLSPRSRSARMTHGRPRKPQGKQIKDAGSVACSARKRPRAQICAVPCGFLDLAEDADDLAEDGRLGGHDRLHRLVLGLEADVVVLAEEALDRRLLAD